METNYENLGFTESLIQKFFFVAYLFNIEF